MALRGKQIHIEAAAKPDRMVMRQHNTGTHWLATASRSSLWAIEAHAVRNARCNVNFFDGT